MRLPLRDNDLHTYADYCSWPEDVRYELIDGVAYARGPAPSRLHQELVGELFFQVRRAQGGQRCRPDVAPFDVRLPRSAVADADIDTVVQPDLAVGVLPGIRIDWEPIVGLRPAPE